MAKDKVLKNENKLKKNKFIDELFEKTDSLPFKSENGNNLIVVDMEYCSNIFKNEAEKYFFKNNNLRLHIIGSKYYLEVLNGITFHDAYTDLS